MVVASFRKKRVGSLIVGVGVARSLKALNTSDGTTYVISCRVFLIENRARLDKPDVEKMLQSTKSNEKMFTGVYLKLNRGGPWKIMLIG